MKNLYITIIFSVLPLFSLGQNVTTRDGGQYKGELLHGRPEGKGKATYKNGDYYEGEYVKGKRQGEGTYVFSDG